jgi:hypothetical protein
VLCLACSFWTTLQDGTQVATPLLLTLAVIELSGKTHEISLLLHRPHNVLAMLLYFDPVPTPGHAAELLPSPVVRQ